MQKYYESGKHSTQKNGNWTWTQNCRYGTILFVLDTQTSESVVPEAMIKVPLKAE